MLQKDAGIHEPPTDMILRLRRTALPIALLQIALTCLVAVLARHHAEPPRALLSIAGIALLGIWWQFWLEKRVTVLGRLQMELTDTLERHDTGWILLLHQHCKPLSKLDTPVQTSCKSALRILLPRLATGDLRTLSAAERKALVHLTRDILKQDQVGPFIFRPFAHLSSRTVEFSIVLFLTLASLKQPGMEREARAILKHNDEERLREAAQEYLSAL
jgi:hypothetical protein